MLASTGVAAPAEALSVLGAVSELTGASTVVDSPAAFRSSPFAIPQPLPFPGPVPAPGHGVLGSVPVPVPEPVEVDDPSPAAGPAAGGVEVFSPGGSLGVVGGVV
jgi:hypothetical protein